ncbi:MAG: PIN domain-containing protein [Phycisphaerales bacterium]|nr:PIN domain-containing protein [Phycisphaerales bacterium]
MKWAKAREILKSLGASGFGVVSTQVLQEFYNILVHKLRMPPAAAKIELLRHSRISVVTITLPLIHAAADLHAVDTISFWDALIVVAAQAGGCDELWTEDLQDGRSFGGLKVRNPFVDMS